MEQNLNNRVYINPNFKRTDNDPWPTSPIKTTHFNRHYLEEMPNLISPKTNETMINNRKIYVNPNFISGNNVTQTNPPASAVYFERNKNVNNASNIQLLHRSKYSLIQNFHQSIVNEAQTSNIIEINKNYALASNLTATQVNKKSNTQGIQPARALNIDTNEIVNNAISKQLIYKSKYSLVQNVLSKEQVKANIEKNKNNQNTKKPTQEVLLTRSRYCIVRKKKRLSVTVEQGIQNNSPTDLVTAKYPVTLASVNQLTRYSNLHSIKNSQKNKVSCKTPEKITKIKLSKYKTVPASYLKKNTAVEINTRLSSSLSTLNRSRFRFIKPSTPIKFTTPVSSIKAASRIIQHIEKSACSGSKVKSSKSLRAKFNINNIPCRLFTKFGKCLRKDHGSCKYLHDKKHVSLCRKFLKGICHDKNCSLSHETTAKKMPTCYFYLKGMCTKDGCPYLHVKLSDKTKICEEFAKGYCENGDKCPFKHVDQLKKAKKSSRINRRCSQNRDSNSTQKKSENKILENCEKHMNSGEIKEHDDNDCRYYKELINSDDSYETIKPKRCKLGTLPSFIQL
ncbi:zinc finger CCCH domain-containing protein 3 [Pararge aegeria]|nr:zinc finger CCCH domain-containing protein 3 [Pararge aegeria]